MDLRMPGADGITAIERIARLNHPPVVVVLTTFDADQYLLRALRAGAAGFLVKSTPPGDLIGPGPGRGGGPIAARLYLSEAAVKGYVSRMLVKLGCANRTQAGLLAHDAGIASR